MRVLFIIRPEIYHRAGCLLAELQSNHIDLLAMKTAIIRDDQARILYASHEMQPYFQDLLRYTTTGTSLLVVLQLDAKVHDMRAIKNQIREKYNLPSNAFEDELSARAKLRFFEAKQKAKETYWGVHASDEACGEAEVALFFSKEELNFVPDPVSLRAEIILGTMGSRSC